MQFHQCFWNVDLDVPSFFEHYVNLSFQGLHFPQQVLLFSDFDLGTFATTCPYVGDFDTGERDTYHHDPNDPIGCSI